MDSPSSKTGDNMPTHATDTTPATDGIGVDGTPPSLEHGDSPKQYTAPIDADADEYIMKHERRGRAIIFNHEKYEHYLCLKERTGTHVDKIRLKELFVKLNFDVVVYDDLNRDDIKKTLYDVSTASHKNADCLVVAVLTQCEEDKTLYACNGRYTADLLWSYFKADVCPDLDGKPKIFIIQACRGRKISDQFDFKSSIQLDSTKMNEDGIIHGYSIPVEADHLVAFSTYEGFVSVKCPDDGTWFIQDFCKELEENGEKLDLLTLFTNVSRRVDNRLSAEEDFQDLKQMPVIQSTLTRKVFFSSTTKHSLQPSKQTKPLPQAVDVFRLKEALKIFLEKKDKKLQHSQKLHGEAILTLLSNWEHLIEHSKLAAYKNLIEFFNQYAKDWKWYKILPIPDSSTVSGQ